MSARAIRQAMVVAALSGLTGCQGVVGLMSPKVPVGSGEPDPSLASFPPEVVDMATRFFPGTEAARPRKQLARLTRRQLDNTAAWLLPTHASTLLAANFPQDPLQTNYLYADNLSIGPANFTPYRTWVEQMVSSVKANPASVINCSSGAPSCLRSEAERFLRQAFRDTLSGERLTAMVDFYAASVAEVGLGEATADLVDLAMTSPGYIFRDEVTTEVDNTLAPAQRLQALSFILADVPPDALGLASGDAVTLLESPAASEAVVDKILGAPQVRAKLTQFFTAWLEIKEAGAFTIAPSVFPEFTPTLEAAMLDETDRFLKFQLSKAAPTLKDVTQSTESFVSQTLASIYGPNQLTGTATVELDTSQRIGVFTQPAMIVSHSGPSDSRLIKRGVFFTRKVMCLPLGTVPQGVDTSLPVLTGASARQKVEEATKPLQCMGCHQVINPFAFMQENYDALGRWRTADNGVPIDPSISVNFLEEGPFAAGTSVEALKGLTNSARFKQCFVRQLFRFYMGREETADDAPLLRKMFVNFVDGDRQDILQQLKILGTASRTVQRAEAP